MEKAPKNNNSNKRAGIKPKSPSIEGNNIKTSKKKCEFCNSIVDDLVIHYQYYHLNKFSELIVPNKRDTALLNEKLSNGNTDERGIEENNKKILLREFKPNLHSMSSKDKENKNYLTSEKFINYNKNFKKFEKVQKVNYNKLFQTDSKDQSKPFVNNGKKYNFLTKSPKSNIPKKFEQLTHENIDKTENKYYKNQISFNITNSPPIKSNHFNYSNEILDPLYFFT